MSLARKIVTLSVASAVAVVCALQAGCIPYAYPNLMSVPAVRLDPGVPVHAFRVEVTGQVADLGAKTDDYALARIDQDNGNRLPAQSDLSLEYGLHPIHHGKTLLVRLYRPGYELVELRAGDDAKVEWLPAVAVAAQERAIDALLSVPNFRTPDLERQRAAREREITAAIPLNVPPGSRSPKHHDALLFAAGEYERLVAKAERAGENAGRLRDKAAAVRARAAE